MRNSGGRRRFIFVTFLALTVGMGAGSLGAQTHEEDPFGSVESLVEGLYGALSFETGGEPDWDHVRGFFLEEAIVVFAQGPAGEMRVLSVDGFIQDFQEFHEQIAEAGRSFSEVILSSEITTHGNISHVMVEFQPHVDGVAAGRKGWDSVELTYVDDRWKILFIGTDWER